MRRPACESVLLNEVYWLLPVGPGAQCSTRQWCTPAGHRTWLLHFQPSCSNPLPARLHPLPCSFGASADHWRKNLGELGQSCRAYAIDLLGYGFSDKASVADGADHILAEVTPSNQQPALMLLRPALCDSRLFDSDRSCVLCPTILACSPTPGSTAPLPRCTTSPTGASKCGTSCGRWWAAPPPSPATQWGASQGCRCGEGGGRRECGSEGGKGWGRQGRRGRLGAGAEGGR